MSRITVMRPAKRKHSRPALRTEDLVVELRSRIVGGTWGPDSRLPTRTELEKQYQVSPATLQRVLDSLIEDGFVHPRGRLGTFVSANPPHLSRYALLFGMRPTDEEWTRFAAALANEASALPEDASIQMPVFYGLEPHTANAGYVRLMEDIRSSRLAGMILPFNPTTPMSFHQTPLFAPGSPPKVGLLSFPPGVDNMMLMVLDHRRILDRAVEYLYGRGRRRIALLTTPQLVAMQSEYFRNLLLTRGMSTEPFWIQSVSLHGVCAAKNLMHLMMAGANRPDGLIILDDNLVEPATAGIMAAGIDVPGMMDVVGHSNFPWPTPSMLPIKRIGFHAGELLRQALGLFEKARNSRVLPPPEHPMPMFEDEVVSLGGGITSPN